MTDVYKFVSGDTYPQIQLTLSREDGSVINLANSEVYFYMRPKGSNEVILTRTAVITDADNGEAVIVWEEGNLDLQAGMYEGEIEVVTDIFRETVYDLLQIQIRSELA